MQAATLNVAPHTNEHDRTSGSAPFDPPTPNLQLNDYNSHAGQASSTSASNEASSLRSRGSNRKSHNIPVTSKPQKRTRSARLWRREILACVLFIASLLALFATLYAYSSKPSPEWPTWLSLNTIVAIYIVLLKTGILFVAAEGLGQLKWSWFDTKERPLDDLVVYDDATRGPWGATVLLWRLRARDILSSLGALVTILCLATDPFAQQIVRYYDCPIRLNEPATIPRTNFWANQDGVHSGALYQTLSPPIMRSILAGVFSPVEQPRVGCATGNCTWASEYSTVGWCSTCKDITNEVEFENRTITSFNSLNVTSWNYTTSLQGGGLSLGVVHFDSMVNYSAMGITPDDRALKMGGDFSASIDFLLTKNVLSSTFMDSSAGFTPVDPGTGSPVEGCNSTSANGTWPCMGYGASRCSLYPCVKTFSANIESGRLIETLQSTFSEWGFVSDLSAFTIVDATCLTDDQRNRLAASGLGVSTGRRWQPLGAPDGNSASTQNTTDSKRALSMELLEQGCLYAVDLTFMNSFLGWLYPLFAGVVSGPPAGVYGAQVGQFSGPQVVQSFFNFGQVTFDHVDSLFGNVTQSFTNYIRQNGYNYTKPALGSVQQTKTCIAIRWPFLIYPSALVILALGFFITMLIATRPAGHRPEIWKSSPLPLLYHGLRADTDNGGEYLGVERKREMEILAKATEVRLDRSAGGSSRLEIRGARK